MKSNLPGKLRHGKKRREAIHLRRPVLLIDESQWTPEQLAEIEESWRNANMQGKTGLWGVNCTIDPPEKQKAKNAFFRSLMDKL